MATAYHRETFAGRSPTGRISITCHLIVQRPIGALCYHNLAQYGYGFIIQKMNLAVAY
jgi:hypothetical protein